MVLLPNRNRKIQQEKKRKGRWGSESEEEEV